MSYENPHESKQKSLTWYQVIIHFMKNVQSKFILKFFTAKVEKSITIFVTILKSV